MSTLSSYLEAFMSVEHIYLCYNVAAEDAGLGQSLKMSELGVDLSLEGNVYGTLPQQWHYWSSGPGMQGPTDWSSMPGRWASSADPAFTLKDTVIGGHPLSLSRIHCPDSGFLKPGAGTALKGPSDFSQLFCSDIR